MPTESVVRVPSPDFPDEMMPSDLANEHLHRHGTVEPGNAIDGCTAVHTVTDRVVAIAKPDATGDVVRILVVFVIPAETPPNFQGRIPCVVESVPLETCLFAEHRTIPSTKG